MESHHDLPDGLERPVYVSSAPLRVRPCTWERCTEPHKHRTEVDGIMETFQCNGKATSQQGGGDISKSPVVQRTTEYY